MKKVRYILIVVLLLVFAITQIKAQAYTTISDSINGNETVNFTVMRNTKTITALCTQIGGTSDGNLTLQGSLDQANWVFINAISPGAVLTASPQASLTSAEFNKLTITDGLVASWILHTKAYPYYRIQGIGTASDSTLITIRYNKW